MRDVTATPGSARSMSSETVVSDRLASSKWRLLTRLTTTHASDWNTPPAANELTCSRTGCK